MKKNVLTTPRDKLLNLAVGAGIPFGTAASGAAGGCTGICGSCGCKRRCRRLHGYLWQLRRHLPWRLCAGSLALRQRVF